MEKVKTSWNKGLTKETSDKLKKVGESISKIKQQQSKLGILYTRKGHTFNGKLCPKCGKIHKDTTGKNNVSNLPNIKEKMSIGIREAIKKKPGFMKGKNNIMYGKCHSEETKQKMREKMLGRHSTPEAIEKARKTVIERGSLKGDKNPAKRLDVRKKISIALSSGIVAGNKNPNWKGGTSFTPYPFEFNTKLRNHIRDRDNYRCRICGILELKCLTRLGIHHINHDKTDNSDINLISLCCSCHSRTNGNRVYWENTLNAILNNIIRR